jgi:SAM-dependent methyltransferase
MIAADSIPSRTAVSIRATPLLFTATTFTASALLFVVQPMFARMVLPKLGGSPAVWNTCVLFFQTTLLLGYLYAHLTTSRLRVRTQAVLHIVVMLSAVVLLPLSLGGAEPEPGMSPVWWLLKTLTWRLGLPFLALSTMAPTVQRWFASLPVPSASNPYFLYAASNLGSMLALLAYPFVIEPAWGTTLQTHAWSAGYGVLLLLAGACVLQVKNNGQDLAATIAPVARTESRPSVDAAGFGSARSATAGPGPDSKSEVGAKAGVTTAQRLRWILLAFIPSSLMLGVTTHVSTDLATIPLLWVLPLATYLLTFILAFSERTWISARVIARAFPLLVLAVIGSIVLQLNAPVFIPLHLIGFFVVALLCHSLLSSSRPAARHLTDFYLWMSFGGTLGGVFNTLIAPHVFNGILEYPLILALACFVRPVPGYRQNRIEPLGLVAALTLVPILACVGMWAVGKTPPAATLGPVLLIGAMVSAAVSTFFNRTWPFNGMVVGGMLLVIIVASRLSPMGVPVFAGRSFFGVMRVIEAKDQSFHLLQHGSTVHGRQNLPAGAACDPQAYYHPSSPVGELFRESGLRFRKVGVIGLGSGGLACYSQAGDQWTFFEIDPLVERVARDARLFTFLQNSRGMAEVVIGDGRKKIEEVAPASFDLVVLDAFSSDSVPMHLLTREALQLYLSRLRPGGIIAYHISNRYLQLEAVVGTLAAAQRLVAVARLDDHVPPADAARGRIGSNWVVVASSEAPLKRLESRPGWRVISTRTTRREWTDDYSNLLETVRFLR